MAISTPQSREVACRLPRSNAASDKSSPECIISTVKVLRTATLSLRIYFLTRRATSRYVRDYSRSSAHVSLTPQIGDYGASTVYRLPWESTIHMSTGLCGSEPYIAPEQFMGKRKQTSAFRLIPP